MMLSVSIIILINFFRQTPISMVTNKIVTTAVGTSIVTAIFIE